MSTRLIVARHGNTFTSDQTPTRVGCRTDIPLVESGRTQALRIGTYFKDKGITPTAIYTSELKRTIEMAAIIKETAMLNASAKALPVFNEIDYGPDENMPEDKVIERIGIEAIEKWNETATPPQGWIVDTKQIIQDLKEFAQMCVENHHGETILAITSNGVARFLPHLLETTEHFTQDLKVSTGAFCVLEKDDNQKFWKITEWNKRP